MKLRAPDHTARDGEGHSEEVTLHAEPAALINEDQLELATALADQAVARAGVSIRALEELTDVHAVSDLLVEVWGTKAESPPLTADFMRALAHSGGYVMGVFNGSDLIGASVGFLGWHGTLSLHSHITGLRAPARNRGVGFAVKVHQRAWALRHGIDTITWTFDPLQRRNAYFNVTKLGATVETLLPNFYGQMRDSINAGDESDRFSTAWHLTDASTIAALDRRSKPTVIGLDPTQDHSRIVLGTTPSGAPRMGNPEGDLVFVPADVAAIRAGDPALGRQWRLAVREAATAKLTTGALQAVTTDGWYVFNEGTSS